MYPHVTLNDEMTLFHQGSFVGPIRAEPSAEGNSLDTGIAVKTAKKEWLERLLRTTPHLGSNQARRLGLSQTLRPVDQA